MAAKFSRPGEHPYGDIGQLVFLFVFLVVWLLDSFVLKYSTFLTDAVPLAPRLITTGLTFILSFLLVKSGHRAVSDEVLSSPRLLRDGAFAFVRHPLYLAALLFYICLISITLSLVSLGLFGFIFFFYNSIARYEEGILLGEFGEEYLEYKKGVPRWIPRFKIPQKS